MGVGDFGVVSDAAKQSAAVVVCVVVQFSDDPCNPPEACRGSKVAGTTFAAQHLRHKDSCDSPTTKGHRVLCTSLTDEPAVSPECCEPSWLGLV